MFIDWAPILDNNTEEMVSDLDIEAGRFTENPPSLSCVRMVFSSLSSSLARDWMVA